MSEGSLQEQQKQQQQQISERQKRFEQLQQDSNQEATHLATESSPVLPRSGALLLEAYEKVLKSRPVAVAPNKVVLKYTTFLVRLFC